MVRAVALLLLAFVAIEAIPANHEHLAKWSDFKKTHGKSYESTEEENTRFNIFSDNLHQIESHNEGFKTGVHSFQQGMNKFGDMTNLEFRSRMNGYRRTTPKPSGLSVFQATMAANDVPAAVDWRTKGYVTDIKDQGQCGSCWSFSATGSLEGQHFKKNGKLVSLSEQNLIDCSSKFGNEGCNGGFPDDAFAYIKSNNGIDTEASYPYKAKDGKCAYNKANSAATVTGSTDIQSGDESALEQAIATVGPISIAIDASKDSFQFYKSGVYYESKCRKNVHLLDHAVLAVGYGTDDNGTKYYIVKNSWGTDWGLDGYILMSREKSNNCGIATDASYPVV